jgi:hypothetical protein
MGNNSESWKTALVAGTLTVAVTSAVTLTTGDSGILDPKERLQAIRDLAKQDQFSIRNRDGSLIVAQKEYTKIDGGDRKKDSDREK